MKKLTIFAAPNILKGGFIRLYAAGIFLCLYAANNMRFCTPVLER
jgi:hypothetical protein